MATIHGSFLAAGLAAALAAGALALVPARAGEGDAPAAPAAPDGAALVKALGDPDFEVRERAWDALRKMGPAAREALEKGAASEDAQVRWSSGRLIGLLEEGGEEEGKEGAENRLPFRPGGAWEDVLRFRDGGGFPDLDEAMEEARRRMAELERRFEGLRREGLRPGPGSGERRTVSRHLVEVRDGERREVAVGPDGKVTVTLERAPDRSGRSGTFEAGSVEELKKAYPDVHDAVKDLLEEGAGSGSPRGLPELPPLPDWPRLPEFPSLGRLYFGGGAAPPEEGLLGVVVAPLPGVLRAHVAVPEGEGLVVERVVEGSAAERIGLRRFDLILSVDDAPVASAGEIRAAWGRLEEGGAVRIRVIRGGEERVLEGAR